MSIHAGQRRRGRDVSPSEVRWAIEHGPAEELQSGLVEFKCERVGTPETVLVRADPDDNEIVTVVVDQH